MSTYTTYALSPREDLNAPVNLGQLANELVAQWGVSVVSCSKYLLQFRTKAPNSKKIAKEIANKYRELCDLEEGTQYVPAVHEKGTLQG